jgi:hypothetical protein
MEESDQVRLNELEVRKILSEIVETIEELQITWSWVTH